MKNGFTLIELMVVIVIMAIVTAGATISFEQTTSSTNKEELSSRYKDMQTAAKVYVESHDSFLQQLIENKEVYVAISLLKNTNFVDSTLKNPITNQVFPDDYYVKVYITGSPEYVSSCVVQTLGSTDTCIANHKGEGNNCCLTE